MKPGVWPSDIRSNPSFKKANIKGMAQAEPWCILVILHPLKKKIAEENFHLQLDH